VRAVSELDGTVRVVLLPPAGVDLLAPQQAALESMLSNLDSTATTPGDTREGLVAMAHQYRWEVNTDFRNAVDGYFGSLGKALLESINAQDYMSAWSYVPATILAYVDAADAASGGPVEAMAVLTLAFKNWLGPWLQTYRDVAQAANPLDQALQQVVTKGGEPAILLGNVYDNVQQYVSGERGRAGEYIGRQIAQTSLRNLLDNGLGSLPPATRVAIFPAVQATGQAVAQAGLSTAAVAHQAEATLQRQVTGKLNALNLGDITNRLGALEGRLATAVDRDTLTAALAGKVDTATFTSALAGKLDSAAFNSTVAGLASKDDLASVRQALADKVDNAAFSQALAQKADSSQLTQLQNDLSTRIAAKADATQLTQIQSDLLERLNAKADVTVLSQLAGEVNTHITRLDNAVTGLNKKVFPT
jgi:hypothetical protein